MSNLNVSFCGIDFKNPVITASGTFGSGEEFSEILDLNKLGGVTLKGVSYEPWLGNPPPRVAETYGGMLNSIGLQNPGVKKYIEKDLTFISNFDTRIIANVCGHTINEYINVISALNETCVDLFELNISCPNLDEGGIAFGTDTKMVEKIVKETKNHSKKPLVVKLSPNVTNISEIAKSAESGGADGISLINTLLGMKIDIRKKTPYLANITGGLSGPSIKPVAIRMIYQVAKSVKIPIIGMGGIQNSDDAIEFLMAGATLIAVGTANFANPLATIDILEGINNYLIDNKIDDIKELIGVVL